MLFLQNDLNISRQIWCLSTLFTIKINHICVKIIEHHICVNKYYVITFLGDILRHCIYLENAISASLGEEDFEGPFESPFEAPSEAPTHLEDEGPFKIQHPTKSDDVEVNQLRS